MPDSVLEQSKGKLSSDLALAQSSQSGGATVGQSNASAKDAQMTQGVDLARGQIASALESGESKKGENNPYGTFNYYVYKPGEVLHCAYFGLVDGKPIYEHTVGSLLDKSIRTSFKVSFLDGDKDRDIDGRLFAMGRYQIIPDTLETYMTQVGLNRDDLFSPHNQDVLYTEGLIGKNTDVGQYLNTGENIEAAARNMAQTWAAIGIKPGSMNKRERVGTDDGMMSYYQGDGVNSGHVSYFTIIEALKADRAAVLAGGRARLTVVHGNTTAEDVEKNLSTLPSPSGEAVGSNDSPVKSIDSVEETGSVDIDVARAVRVNKQYNYSSWLWRDIQKAVGLTGRDVDGAVGPITCRAIADWQSKNGFIGREVDGICGPNTLSKINVQKASSGTVNEPKSETVGSNVVKPNTTVADVQQASSDVAPAQANTVTDVTGVGDTGKDYGTLKKGSTGEGVIIMQKYLNLYLAKYDGQADMGALETDGKYGPGTFRRVAYYQYSRNLQSAGGIDVDGVCGPGTWGALRRGAPEVHDIIVPKCFSGRVCKGSYTGVAIHGGGTMSSEAASAFNDMYNDALKAGHTLTASSTYRGMTDVETQTGSGNQANQKKGQIRLFEEYDGNESSCARPGKSNHQSGVAVDIAGIQKKGDTSAKYKWLHGGDIGSCTKGTGKNKYGFAQYSRECWHWDYVGR